MDFNTFKINASNQISSSAIDDFNEKILGHKKIQIIYGK